MDSLNIRPLDPTPEHPYPRFYLDVRIRRAGGGENRVRETLKTGSYAKAKARYLEIQAQLRNGSRETVAVPPGTFGDVLERYRLRRGEILGGQLTTFQTLAKDLGQTPLGALEGAFERYASVIRNTVSPRTGRRYSNATVNRLRSMATAAINLAIDLRILERNPLTRAVWPKAKELSRDRILSADETMRLLNVIDREAPHLGPLARFSLAVPARKGELVNARREWLDEIAGVIRVPGKAGKGGRGSVKPIPPDLLPYFRSLPSETPFLFFRRHGGRYHPLGDFKRSWHRCLALAGIGDFRFHDLRHVACTNLLAAGSNLKAVQMVGGWADSKMVDKYHSFSGISLRDGIRFPIGTEGSRVRSAYTSGEEIEKGVEYRENKAVS